MKNLLRIGVLSVAVLSLTLAAGCGDDDDPTGPTEKAIGDLNDAEYEQVMSGMETGEFFTEMMMNNIFQVVDGVMAGGVVGSSGDRARPVTMAGVEADTLFLTYHSTSDYWYLYAELNLAGPQDTTVITIVDSVQFMHGSVIVQWPDSALLNAIRTGASLSMESTQGSSLGATHLLSLTGDIADRGDVVLDGSQSLDMLLAGEGCTLDFDLNVSADDVGLNIIDVDEGDCPESGVFRHAGTIGMVCTGPNEGTYNDSWTITQTFNGDNTYTIVAENSTTRWTHTDTCGT